MKNYGLLFFLVFLSSNINAADKTVIRIGVQASGTLAWELSVIQNDDKFNNATFQIDSHSLANAEAGKIALQSGSVDMIVSDWLWVSRLRLTGADFVFYPYSTTAGALVVPENSNIRAVKDLKDKRLGIVGGELDKSWLLLQALAKQDQFDLNASVEKIYGAPPLISEQLKQGRVDAMLNYWHFAAKLETQGYRQLLNGKEILKGLGIQEAVPTLGYVFKQSWAADHKAALNNFLQMTKEAKSLLCNSDSTWQSILTLTEAKDKPTQIKLRQRYCEGNVQQWGQLEQKAAERVYTLLRAASHSLLTGNSEHIQSGTFWAIE